MAMGDFLSKVQRYCNDKYKLEMRAKGLRDNRESFKISAFTIFFVLFYGLGIFRKRSLLGVDQFVRMSEGKRLFNRESPVVSDTTINTSIKGYDIEKLREMGSAIYLVGRSSGQYKYETCSGKKLKVGIIDGSEFGSVRASCFQQVGRVSTMIDLEEIPKMGKELPTSKETFSKEVKEVVISAMKLSKERENMKEEEYKEEVAEIEERFSNCLDKEVSSKVNIRLKKRLIKHREEIFPFLYDSKIPFDNNGSERDIRKIVIKRKVSGGSRSMEGAKRTAIINSVIETIRKRGGDVLEELKRLLGVKSNLAIL